MSITLDVRNRSARKRLHRRDTLTRIAERVVDGEGAPWDAEVSVLLCDDDFMTGLNRQYRDVDAPTDVLSFEQDGATPDGVRTLGDIVISLETVERHCGGDRRLMREEVALLFCHGLMHLLGYDHGTAREQREMAGKQAQYLGVSENDAWRFGPRTSSRGRGQSAPTGGSSHLGR